LYTQNTANFLISIERNDGEKLLRRVVAMPTENMVRINETLPTGWRSASGNILRVVNSLGTSGNGQIGLPTPVDPPIVRVGLGDIVRIT